ncbi:MAG: Rieske (2Fe-2S) protein [Haloarculaceae archaeon]
MTDRDRHRVASADELAEEGSRVISEVAGQEVAVFRVEGGLHALANYCVHQAGPLCEGPLTGRLSPGEDGSLRYEESESVVRCPWHGWRFDVRTGESLQSDRWTAPTYEVEVEDGDVYIRR